MIAILNTEIEAVELAANIHSYLLTNREGYNAERWGDLNKSESEDKWAVKIPKEFLYVGEVVNKLPDGWVINKEL